MLYTGSTRAKRDIDDGRLPLETLPRHYNLELRPDIYSNPEPPFNFYGSVEIFVTCQLATNHVTLNVDSNLEYTSLSLIVDPDSPVITPSPILLQVKLNIYLIRVWHTSMSSVYSH